MAGVGGGYDHKAPMESFLQGAKLHSSSETSWYCSVLSVHQYLIQPYSNNRSSIKQCFIVNSIFMDIIDKSF